MSRELLGPQHVGSAGPVLSHPTIQIMSERLAAGSRRGARQDDHLVALAIEGGGVAGAVPGGACVTLESAGLVETVDRIYGTSSGALDGSFTAAGQAAVGATNFEDIMIPGFAKSSRLLRRQPPINFDYLFDDIIGQRKPLDADGLAQGPDFRAISVNLDTLQAEVLKDFEDVEELMLAVRASCAMPVLSGPPVMYRGRPMVDGALLASVPFRAALDEGASHVLALRSRGKDYAKRPYSRGNILGTRYLPFGGAALAQLVADRPAIYNADAEVLRSGELPSVVQIAPDHPHEPVAQLEKSVAVMRSGFRLGMMATAKTFGIPALEVDWQQFPPAVYLQPAV